jgi:AcrR family transcriptional regulator
MNSVQPVPPRRYHHGDLANALTGAATQLAREGGPEAVVLREAARSVGVSATAAYRHFAGHGELMHAVKERAGAALADRMRTELAAGEPATDPQGEALRRLAAIGLGYLGFALAEPGLFRTAFCRAEGGPEEAAAEMTSAPAFQLLAEALDSLVTVGLLAAERRPFAEIFAWSCTHGLAMLLLDGPLSQLGEPERAVVIENTLARVVAGLISG